MEVLFTDACTGTHASHASKKNSDLVVALRVIRSQWVLVQFKPAES
jgi:hypothetical protein